MREQQGSAVWGGATIGLVVGVIVGAVTGAWGESIGLGIVIGGGSGIAANILGAISDRYR